MFDCVNGVFGWQMRLTNGLNDQQTLNFSDYLDYLRGIMWVLEIVCVGQYEVFVCLDFVAPPPPLLATELICPCMGCQFFKNKMLIFPTYSPLIQ